MDTTQVLDRAESLMREMATTLGQPALDVAMAAAQAQAIGSLVSSGIGATAAIALAVFGFRHMRKNHQKYMEAGRRTEDRYIAATVGCGCLFVAAAFVSIPTTVSFTDIATWTAAFDGRIALALKVLG